MSFQEKLRSLEREIEFLRKRVLYLERFIRPPATYRMTQEELLDYGKTIWTPDPPPLPVAPQRMGTPYLDAVKRPGH